MLPPLPRCSNWVSSSLISPSCISLPRFHCRVGLHIVLFEDCSAFTHVAACTLPQSPYSGTGIRGLQTFRRLHACPGCFRRERSPGGRCTHWKSAALSRRDRKLISDYEYKYNSKLRDKAARGVPVVSRSGVATARQR